MNNRVEIPAETTDFSECSPMIRRVMERFQMRLEIERLKKRVARLEYENARLERRAKKYGAQLDEKSR